MNHTYLYLGIGVFEYNTSVTEHYRIFVKLIFQELFWNEDAYLFTAKTQVG